MSAGWKLVPETLTEDMRSSLMASVRLYGYSGTMERRHQQITNLWSDVLNIAPERPAAATKEGGGVRFEKEVQALKDAEDALERALRRAYPEGKDFRFHIQHGQVTPSRGTVIGHDGGRFARVRFRLYSRTNQTRSVAAEDII